MDVNNHAHSFWWFCQKLNIASSLFFVPICAKGFKLKPALQSDSASHLWHNFVLASGWEKISVELPPPAHHLLPLTGDQQLVEERAVGAGPAIIMRERWLRCRERLKLRTCRIHIGFARERKIRHNEFIFLVMFINLQLWWSLRCKKWWSVLRTMNLDFLGVLLLIT